MVGTDSAEVPSLLLSAVCYAKLNPPECESQAHGTCACVNIFVTNNASWAFSGPSRNMNLHYCDPSHHVTHTYEQTVVSDICESLLPSQSSCPPDEVY